ncbi:hypothetical protein ATANTOWER_031391 [Ataeniobius toweri]|uniref:Uncharacterized protein n=1 Tax=Ataeniobius toweri TaxID=208326 RepID=A0ABU7C7P3_9TELE|nr:hypothetical protein [Ataeniobius toweri]
MDIWRQAGILWVSPSCDTILFRYLTEGQQLEERGKGGKDTPLLGWRETREREPNPDPPPPTFFHFFSNIQTFCSSANTQTNMLRPWSDVFQHLCSVSLPPTLSIVL